MDITEKLNGIVGVINTPFNENNQIDSDSLGNYIDHSINAGVAGFLALGMAAETNKLTLEEREFIVKAVVDKVGGRVPVICSVSSDNHNERLLLTRKFIDFGCDAIMVNVLFEDENSFFKQISEIDGLNPECLMIQDWDFKGYGIHVDTIKKEVCIIPDLIDNFNFAGIYRTLRSIFLHKSGYSH
jgi:hypothetical protein